MDWNRWFSLTLLRILIFVGVGCGLAQARSGWFDLAGSHTDCLLNPALECSYGELGPSPWERALVHGGHSQLNLSLANTLEYADDQQRVRVGGGQLDFEFLVGTKAGALVGLAVETPVLSGTWYDLSDSAELQESQPSGHLALLAGVDFLRLIGIENQHAVLAVRAPVYYGPGLWEIMGEWGWAQRVRLRGSYTQRRHRDALQWWWSPDPQFTFRDLVRTVSGQAAFSVRTIQMAAGLSREQHSAMHRGDALTRVGEVWTAEGSLVWRVGPWRLLQQGVAQWRDLEYVWNPAENRGALDGTADGEVYLWRGRLQRTLGQGHRLGLQAEQRLWRGLPGSWNVQADTLQEHWASDLPWAAASSEFGAGRGRTALLGADFRYWVQGLFVEPSLAWATGVLSGDSHPWLLWGAQPQWKSASSTQWDALVLGISLGVSTASNRYVYGYRQAVPLGASPFVPGVEASWGGSHRFEILSSF